VHPRALTVFWLCIACWIPGILCADVVLEFQVRTESTQTLLQQSVVKETRRNISLGAECARLDQDVESYILRTDLGKLFVLNHQTKVCSAVDLPIKLEAYIPEGSQDVAPKAMEILTSDMKLTDTGEVRTLGSWPARRWRANVVFPFLGSSDEYDFWVSTAPDLDPRSYKELMTSIYALDPRIRDWIDEILALEGVVIRSEARKGSGQSLRINTTTELLSIREEEIDSKHYEVPEGYNQVPFRFDMAIQGGTP